MQLLICRPVGWIEGYSVAEDEEDEALEQAVFGLGDGHSETGTLSANPAHSSLDDRVVIEWVHEDDCLVTALTCTAFRDFVRDGCATVSESEWMPVGFKHMRFCRFWWTFAHLAMGKGK